MDLRAYLSERAALVDRGLEALLPPAASAPQSLHRAMRHLLFPGGKRLRPAFAMAGAEAVGGAPESALPMAAAVELVHSYSLIHDDLPCMDDDATRRGIPTVHVAFGEAVALLAGDALLALAFQSLAGAAFGETGGPGAADSGRSLGAVRDLAAAAGSLALVGGQVDDLSCAADPLDADRIESVHERKSAALIAAAIVGGARLAGAGQADRGVLRHFGLQVGVAFQIADDLLDADEGDVCSLVRALGVQGARARAEALLEQSLARIEGWGERAEPLRELARAAVRRDL